EFVFPINSYPTNPQDPPPPIISLIISRMLLDFSEIIIIQVYTSFSDKLYTLRDNKNKFSVDIYGGYGKRHTISKELTQDIREIVSACKDIAQNFGSICGDSWDRISMDIRGLYTIKSFSTNLTDVSSQPTGDSKISLQN
ncbi:22695_t:CDS:2, partial [Racocetra persica]